MHIACIHQGYELYGSDRCFAESVRTIRALAPDARLTVVLPRPGPILDLLQGLADEILYEPLWILRRRGLARLATLGLLRLPLALARAARRLATCDLVYVNTTVVADYLIAARLFPGRTILHVHEIPEGLVRKVLRLLVRWSGAEVVFNSQATRAAFALPACADTRVIYNGIAGPAAPEPVTYDGTRPLRLLMLGRISRIKGQEVLLDAIAALPPAVRARIELRIVGSAFEDAAREAALAARIGDSGMDGRITLRPFDPNPAPHYRWADVVVVPSRLPESLGRVAIEAMAYGRPPVVSAIGGLVEVVEAGRTGWTVPPDDAAALSAALAAIVADPGSLAARAPAARRRFETLFSEAAVGRAFSAMLAPRLARKPRAAAPAVVHP
ncbi:glycosyl transferase family 1 [Methylobacterium sp. Leaf399]|uniref:glycosyltransferase n=1 Tax=Methylobacterium sp. Leaf399 TaxID=1736364 RepID=UPI0006F99B52|nr:glycosyltransferase [Methylobacterium sp. Leaf399]KQT19866.1 glycosyl transferase family 1 [Methylobacterium sp. Leaf399]